MFHHNLFWRKIFNYIDYRSLDDDCKIFIDVIYKELHECFKKMNSHDAYKKSSFESLNSYDFKKLKVEDQHWLIDNPLNIILTDVYGHHNEIRCFLFILHQFKEGKIPKDFIKKAKLTSPSIDPIFILKNKDLFADLYIGLSYGLYESGAMNDHGVSSDFIICADDYPFEDNKQSFLKEKYEIQDLFYTKEDVLHDYKTIKWAV